MAGLDRPEMEQHQTLSAGGPKPMAEGLGYGDNITFKTRVLDSEGNGAWKDVTSDDYFKGKKVVIFSLPGAFTPTCSSTHLPGYEGMYDKLKKYVDEVYCISVNDAFVMNAWCKDQQCKKVKFIPDGEGKFTEQMGMLVDKPAQGFGKRSWRYSAYIDNGKVVRMFVENGKNDMSDDDDPFEVSDAGTMLDFLEGKPTNRLEQMATLSSDAVAPE